MGGRSGPTSSKGNPYGAYLEKYQITDIVNGIKVTRTKFRLRKNKGKKNK